MKHLEIRTAIAVTLCCSSYMSSAMDRPVDMDHYDEVQLIKKGQISYHEAAELGYIALDEKGRLEKVLIEDQLKNIKDRPILSWRLKDNNPELFFGYLPRITGVVDITDATYDDISEDEYARMATYNAIIRRVGDDIFLCRSMFPSFLRHIPSLRNRRIKLADDFFDMSFSWPNCRVFISEQDFDKLGNENRFAYSNASQYHISHSTRTKAMSWLHIDKLWAGVSNDGTSLELWLAPGDKNGCPDNNAVTRDKAVIPASQLNCPYANIKLSDTLKLSSSQPTKVFFGMQQFPEDVCTEADEKPNARIMQKRTNNTRTNNGNTIVLLPLRETRSDFFKPGNTYLLHSFGYPPKSDYLQKLKNEHGLTVSDQPDEFGYWVITKEN